MNDCMNVEAREALPDLMNGRLSELDTATMNAHVESCPECRAELALLREARSTAPIAPSLNANRIAAVISPYGGVAVSLPAAPERRVVSSRMWKFAAAALLVVTGGWLASTQRNQATTDVPAMVAASPVTADSLPALDPSGQPVTAMADTKGSSKTATRSNVEVQVASLSLLGSTTDISDSDLEQLVAELDAIDAIPADEPTPVTITVDDIDGTDEQ